jgi:hypothetical protein
MNETIHTAYAKLTAAYIELQRVVENLGRSRKQSATQVRIKSESAEMVYAMGRPVFEKAEELGLVCFVADDLHLLIDIDSDTNREDAGKALQFFREHTNLWRSDLTTISKSGNIHLYIALVRPVPAIERLALQAIFGSDPMRELLSMAQLGRQDPVTVLFETQKEAPRVTEFLKSTGHKFEVTED